MGIGEILSGVGNVLDMPGSYTRGFLAGRPGDRVGGRELLEQLGVLGENREGLDAGDAVGLGADMLLDPLNLISGAGMWKLASRANKAVRSVEKANEASMALRKAGAMPEEIANLTKIRGDAGPLRLYHETGSPAFGPREFAPDPGSRNWLGKGTYSMTDPSELRGAYTRADKSGSILGEHKFVTTPEQAGTILKKLGIMPKWKMPDEQLVDYANHTAGMMENVAGVDDPFFSGGLQRIEGLYNKPPPPAPRTMMLHYDARNPYQFEDKVGFRELRKLAGADVPGLGTEVPEGILHDAYRAVKPSAKTIAVERKAIQMAMNTPIEPERLKLSWPKDYHGESRSGFGALAIPQKGGGVEVELLGPYSNASLSLPDVYRTVEEAKKAAQELLPEFADVERTIHYQNSLRDLEKTVYDSPNKGQLCGAMAAKAKSGDVISDILRKSGYDAISHERGYAHDFSPRTERALGHIPPVDFHSEVVAFDPSQIYAALVARAIQKPPSRFTGPIADLLGVTGLYNTLARGYSKRPDTPTALTMNPLP